VVRNFEPYCHKRKAVGAIPRFLPWGWRILQWISFGTSHTSWLSVGSLRLIQQNVLPFMEERTGTPLPLIRYVHGCQFNLETNSV
jgi:hypothetical protein